MQLEQDNNGFWFYRELPQGSRKITMADWDSRARILTHNLPIVVLGTESCLYEFYRIIRSAKQGLLQHIQDGRAWIIPNELRPPDTGDPSPLLGEAS
jgi:hypothetical protein